MVKKINLHVNINKLEEEAKNQFDNCCAEDFVLEAALMPDAHVGYVAPIGSVIKTKGAIVPSWVGYDIGCGMIAVLISEDKREQEKIKNKAHEIFKKINDTIPMGAGGHNVINPQKIFSAEYLREILHSEYLYERILDDHSIFTRQGRVIGDYLGKVRESTSNKELLEEVKKRTVINLGTLGSGNHFIEILEHNSETWLVIHSGSRGVGYYVAEYFMKAVSSLEKGFEATFPITDPDIKKEYMLYHDYCLEFALANRMVMALKVEFALREITGIHYATHLQLWTNKNHNHCIEIEENIFLHRKGATSSEKDERGVIPANMRDGCFLVIGLGNKDFLESSSHGAGRALSRTEAKQSITLEYFQQQMKGIVAPITTKTIDESPDAYKDIFEVMALQENSVKVLKHLTPIINWKG